MSFYFFLTHTLEEKDDFDDPMETEDKVDDIVQYDVEDFEIHPTNVENQILDSIKTEVSENLSEIDENSSPHRCVFVRFHPMKKNIRN